MFQTQREEVKEVTKEKKKKKKKEYSNGSEIK